MIRRNEERIGRLHIYFAPEDNDWSPGTWADPTDPNSPGWTNSPYTGAGGMGGPNTMPTRTPTPMPDSGSTMTVNTGVTDPNKWGGMTTSTGTNYTNLSPTSTSINVTTPTSAAEAMDRARTGNADKAATAASDPRRAFDAANKESRRTPDQLDKGGVESMGADVVEALTGARALGSMANTALTAGAVSSWMTKVRAAESAIRGALTAAGIGAKERNNISNSILENASNMTDEQIKDLANSLSSPNAEAIKAAVDRIKSANNAAAAVAEAIEDGIVIENAAEKGADTVKKALVNNVKDGGKKSGDSGAQHTNLGIADSMLRAIQSGKVDVEAGAKFMIGAQQVMAKMGYAVTESQDVPKKELSINGFVNEFGDVVESEESIANSEEQVNSFIDAQIENAIIQLAAQLGLSQDEISELKDAIDKINDTSASIEDRKSAYKDLVKSLLDKFNGSSPWAQAEIYKILIGLFEKQVDKITSTANELKDAKEIFKLAKIEGSDVLVSEALATVEQLSEDLKNEFEFAKEQEAVCQRVKYNISLDVLEQYVTEESEAIYQVARERLNVGSVGLKKAGAAIKFLGAIVIAPFSPKFCVKTIKTSCRILANEGRAASQAIPIDVPMEELIDDPAIRQACIELVEKERKLYADAGKMVDLENKIIKDLIKMFAFLLTGAIPLAFFYSIKLTVNLIRLASYSTEPEINGENELDWNKLMSPDTYDTDDGTVMPEPYIAAYMKLIKKFRETKYENLYGRDFVEGGNQNVENAEGYNYGVGSEEEIANYIRNNVNKDRVARRLAQGL